MRLCCITVLILGQFWAPCAVGAPKTDVVVLTNGDRLTGEVKGLTQGKLTLKTDSAGTISIEWNKVSALQTRQRLQVRLASGELIFGSAPESAPPHKLRFDQGGELGTIELPLVEIVSIRPFSQGQLIAQLGGYLTAGYSYTKSNNTQEFTFSGGLNSTQEGHRWSVDANTMVTDHSSGQNTQRAQVIGLYRWSLQKAWFWQAMAGAERDLELGLDARGAVGAAIGRYLVQTERQEWVAYAGLAPTHEKPAGAPEMNSLEGLLGTQYAFFQTDTPERRVTARFDVLPSLTDPGRVRSQALIESRYEIVRDFIFQVTLNASYDSRPGPDAKSHADYGVVTSLGFTF